MEHVDELIAAHALHALDPADEQRVASHLADCGECRAKLREVDAVAGALAYAAPRVSPPPELRTRVLAAVRPVTPAAEPQPLRARRRTGWWPRVALVATPALAAAVLALGIWNLSLRDQLANTRNGFAAGVTVHLPGIGNAVANRSGAVTLYTSAPAIPAGKTYEAWVISGSTARPAGLFGAGSGHFTLTQHVASGDTIAVTVEPAGGRPQPTSKPVAVGRVTSV